MNSSELQNPNSKIECPLRHHALEQPKAPALITPDETVSYAALDRRVTATSRRLDERLDADRIALLLPNEAAHVVLLWALWRVGCLAAPLSTRTPPAGLPDLLHAIGSKTLLTNVKDVPPGVETHAPDAVLATDAAPDEPVFFDPEQPATAIFTSGSTGTPKAALHSVGNHYFSALGARANIALGPGDRWLLSLPLYHVGGLAILMRTFEAGAAVVLPQPDASVAEVLPARSVTHASLVPTQLRRLLDHTGTPPPSLKALLLGGGTIPATLTDEAHARGWPIYTSYGLTEMTSQVATTSPDAAPNELHTAGRLLPHRQLRLTDAGEIQVRGRTLFQGYLTHGTLQLATDEEGWFATGDRGRWTGDGLLRITGRMDRMFVSGGENIQPEEIENALLAIEDVRRAMVVSVPDEDYGKRPVAFVESGLSSRTLATHLERTLPRFMVPDAFYDWPDDLAEGMKPDRPAFARRAHRLRSR